MKDYTFTITENTLSFLQTKKDLNSSRAYGLFFVLFLAAIISILFSYAANHGFVLNKKTAAIFSISLIAVFLFLKDNFIRSKVILSKEGNNLRLNGENIGSIDKAEKIIFDQYITSSGWSSADSLTAYLQIGGYKSKICKGLSSSDSKEVAELLKAFIGNENVKIISSFS